MFEKLDVFRLAHAMASHAGARQAVVAQNIANADTPGFAARDIEPFSALVGANGAGTGPTQALRATRPGHLDAAGSSHVSAVTELRHAPNDPNGNSVSLETEMLKSVETKRQHDRALAIYRSSLTILRAAAGRR